MNQGQEGVTWDEWVAIAQACEAHGIGTLFRSDHYQNLDGRNAQRPALDAWATLSALGAITTTLRLGTLVSPASFRHPSVLAKMVVTADHVSGGRGNWASEPAGTRASTPPMAFRSCPRGRAWTSSRSSCRSCSAAGGRIR